MPLRQSLSFVTDHHKQHPMRNALAASSHMEGVPERDQPQALGDPL